MMTLFYSPTSPYARKVRLLALEKGLDARITTVTVDVSKPTVELLASNPLGKVPALLLENGEALFDSPVICRYLDRLDDVPLIPASGWQQWEVLRWEALADGLTDAAYNLVMEQRSRPEQERSPPTMQRWSAEIIRTLQYIETRLETLGDVLTLAHIALGAAVGYLEFRLPQLLQEARCPHIITWYAVFRQRPAMLATQPG